MTSTIKTLNDKITTNLASVTCEQSLGQLVGAADAANSATIDCVASSISLPTASNNTGRFMGVGTSSALCYRYSNGIEWKCDYDSTIGVAKTELWAWGCNSFGQLGTGDTNIYSSPVTTAGGGTAWCQISSSCWHSMSIKTDGTLWSWGRNNVGQLGTNNITNYSSPVTTIAGGTNWCQVSTGQAHTLAIKSDNTLFVWGCNSLGGLGTGNTTSYSSPVTTAGGGTTWCQVDAGGYHTGAIKTDGTLWTWGYNNCGQLGTGNTTAVSSPVTVAGGGTTWCQVSIGNGHVGSIKTDGTLWMWGNNTCGQLGTNDITNYSSPVTTAAGGTTWCQVSVECDGTAALKNDGTLWTWGYNNAGQLGTGNTTVRSSPVTVAGGGTNWCQVSSGFWIKSAIKTDGTLWTWGYNNVGQLGTGNTTGVSSPVTVAGGGTTWCQVSAGNYYVLAIKQVYKGF